MSKSKCSLQIKWTFYSERQTTNKGESSCIAEDLAEHMIRNNSEKLFKCDQSSQSSLWGKSESRRRISKITGGRGVPIANCQLRATKTYFPFLFIVYSNVSQDGHQRFI